MRLVILAITVFFISTPTAAQEKPNAAPPTPQAETRVETDQATGTIRFIVKGKEAAILDETGLHVLTGDLTYSGTIIDAGASPEPKP